MVKRKKLGWVWILAIAVLAVAAYMYLRPSGTQVPAGYGVLEMRITDAPGDMASLLLTISGVRVHQAAADDASGWMTVREQPLQYDLIQLSMTPASALIGDAVLTPGQYTQMRLQVDSATLTLADGTVHQVAIPSGELKLIQGFTIVEGKKLVLTLDFDAQRSVRQNAQGYSLRPTVKLLSENVDCLADADCIGYDKAQTCGTMVKCENSKCAIYDGPSCPPEAVAMEAG